MPSPVYKRILLKLSGEALMGNQGFGVDPLMAVKVAEELKKYTVSAWKWPSSLVGEYFPGLKATSKGWTGYPAT
jgi:uridylate kinase